MKAFNLGGHFYCMANFIQILFRTTSLATMLIKAKDFYSYCRLLVFGLKCRLFTPIAIASFVLLMIIFINEYFLKGLFT